jgi:hypothetical protein
MPPASSNTRHLCGLRRMKAMVSAGLLSSARRPSSSAYLHWHSDTGLFVKSPTRRDSRIPSIPSQRAIAAWCPDSGLLLSAREVEPSDGGIASRWLVVVAPIGNYVERALDRTKIGGGRAIRRSTTVELRVLRPVVNLLLTPTGQLKKRAGRKSASSALCHPRTISSATAAPRNGDIVTPLWVTAM